MMREGLQKIMALISSALLAQEDPVFTSAKGTGHRVGYSVRGGL